MSEAMPIVGTVTLHREDIPSHAGHFIIQTGHQRRRSGASQFLASRYHKPADLGAVRIGIARNESINSATVTGPSPPQTKSTIPRGEYRSGNARHDRDEQLPSNLVAPP